MSKEIKAECEELYEQISNATKRLEQLRTECKHSSLTQVNYSSRPGNIAPALVCADCSKFIRYVYGNDD